MNNDDARYSGLERRVAALEKRIDRMEPELEEEQRHRAALESVVGFFRWLAPIAVAITALILREVTR